jgi:predicted O-methyltransferase YrrM
MDKIIFPNQLDYLSSLRGEVDPLLKEMEEFAEAKRIPILNWNSAELLETFILSKKPKRVLEIGTAIAYSSIRIARVLEEDGIVDTIDKSTDNLKLAMDYIKRSGQESKINLIEGNALALMPQYESEYDFIFLDADKQDYEKLFYISLPLLKKGGIIFVDNLLWHGFAAGGEAPATHINGAKQIREFNKIFVDQPGLKTTIVPVGDGIGIGVKL